MIVNVIITFAIIAASIVFLIYFSRSAKRKPKNVSENKQQTKEEEKPQETTEKKKRAKSIDDNAKRLLKSFKEIKDVKQCIISNNGHILIFCDTKRICFCYMQKLNSKTQKILSKSIDMDLITDISYSSKRRLISCALKNSKTIIFYGVTHSEGKTRLYKLDKPIQTERKFEINKISISPSGNFLCTSGTEQDTEIQIFNVDRRELVQKLDTGGIHNFLMRIYPTESDILISTFLNEISVVNFERSEKFNGIDKKYETLVKFVRKKSISGLKSPILAYEFSNDERFFVVSCEDGNIKVFQNMGNVSESKVFTEFKGDVISDVVCVFVKEFFNGKLHGFVGIAKGRDIYVKNINNGETKLVIEEAHEDKIVQIGIVKVDLNGEDDNEKLNGNLTEVVFEDEKDAKGEIVLISASVDGRIKIWNLNNI